MSLIDLDTLSQPISATQPCGSDLEYDPQVAELEQAVQGKPEQQFGDTIIDAEEPDWSAAFRLSSQILVRTKDIRVAAHLLNAALATGQLADFRDAIKLIAGYVTDHWAGVYPGLDEDDDNDPTERINAIASLRDGSTTLRLLKRLPLLAPPGVGPITLLDVEIARGDVPAPDDAESPTSMATIDGVFLDCEIAMLQSMLEVVRDSHECLNSIESFVTDQVGVGKAVSLDPITDIVQEIQSLVQGYLRRRQTGGEETPDAIGADAIGADASGAGAGGVQAGGDGGAAPHVVVETGEIKNREDVIRAIDRICSYYEKYEPSSPLPLLLSRAKRLVTASFMEIIQDLTPDALDQATQIKGLQPND